MKLFQKKRSNKITAFLLTAGLLCTGLSYSEPIPYVSAVSDTDQSASAQGDVDDAEQKAAGAQVMVKELGAVTYYRWEKLTNYSGLYDKNDWTRIMFIKDDSYIAADVDQDLFYDQYMHAGKSYTKNHTTSQNNISSAKGSAWNDGLADLDNHYIPTRTVWFDKWSGYPEMQTIACWSVDRDNIDIAFLPDRAFHFSQKDPMIQPDRDTFFTDDDRNVPYVRYRGLNSNDCREWDLAFAKDDTSKKYYLDIKQMQTGKPVEDVDVDWVMGYPFPKTKTRSFFNRGGMYIHPEGEDHQGIFLDIKSDGRAQIEDSTSTNRWDDEYFITLTRDAIHGTYVRRTWNDANVTFKAYMGTPIHFSTLDGVTTVSENTVFNVSEGKYVDANGKKKTTDGVLIGNGGKLVIDGGVVSVKGTLINNGTIEIKNGGVLLIQDGASVSSFLAGSDIDKNGCGSIICCGGDIIIENGGALYAGMNDAKGKLVPFYLDNYSTLINCGLLVYGGMRLGKGTRLELRGDSRGNYSTTLGNVFKGKHIGEEKYRGLYEFDPDDQEDMMQFKRLQYNGFRLEYSGNTWSSSGHRKVYEAYVHEVGNPIIPDDEYDMLSYYTKRLKTVSNEIPDSCRGIHFSSGVAGITGPDPGSVTIIQKKYAKFDSMSIMELKKAGFNRIYYDSEGL